MRRLLYYSLIDKYTHVVVIESNYSHSEADTNGELVAY